MDDVRRSTRICVRALPVLADIGIDPHEIGCPQPLLVTVALEVDDVAEDRIEATVDYRLIAREAMALGATRIALVETFADRLAASCLDLDGVRSVAVEIDKPQALPGGTAAVAVTLTRTRRRAHAGPVCREAAPGASMDGSTDPRIVP